MRNKSIPRPLLSFIGTCFSHIHSNILQLHKSYNKNVVTHSGVFRTFLDISNTLFCVKILVLHTMYNIMLFKIFAYNAGYSLSKIDAFFIRSLGSLGQYFGCIFIRSFYFCNF
jgi:hypothetical protein